MFITKSTPSLPFINSILHDWTTFTQFYALYPLLLVLQTLFVFYFIFFILYSSTTPSHNFHMSWSSTDRPMILVSMYYDFSQSRHSSQIGLCCCRQARISSSGAILQTNIILPTFCQTWMCRHCADMAQDSLHLNIYQFVVFDKLCLSYYCLDKLSFEEAIFEVHNWEQSRLNLLHVLLGSLLFFN